MKFSIQIFIFVVICVLFNFKVSSQTSNVYLELDKTNGKIISDTVKSIKTLQFKIGGLDINADVQNFINKFKTLRGVVSATVEKSSVDNSWKATVGVYRFADKKYFQKLFIWSGVNYLIIDHKQYSPQELSSYNVE